MNKRKKLILFVIFRELFQITLVTYLILLLIETLKAGFVSYFFNLNILLGVILISGIAMVLMQTEESSQRVMTDRVWGYFFKKISTKNRIDFWQQTIQDFKVRKLINEDWKNLYRDLYRFPKDRFYWGFLERDWRMFLKDLKKNLIGEKDLYFILFISLLGGFLVFYKTQNLGWISVLISGMTVVVIFLLSLLIYSEDNQ